MSNSGLHSQGTSLPYTINKDVISPQGVQHGVIAPGREWKMAPSKLRTAQPRPQRAHLCSVHIHRPVITYAELTPDTLPTIQLIRHVWLTLPPENLPVPRDIPIAEEISVPKETTRVSGPLPLYSPRQYTLINVVVHLVRWKIGKVLFGSIVDALLDDRL
jgi:hypothetical protein